MRFDLEINIPQKLTKNGLAKIADVIYNGESTRLRHLNWDKKPILNYTTNNIGLVDTSKFTNFKKISNTFFSSSVVDSNSLYLNSIIKNGLVLCPTFIGGNFYSHKNKFKWSSKDIFDKVDWDIIENYYVYNITSDINIDSIEIYTLSFKYPGYIAKIKDFKYVEYDGSSLKSTFESSAEDYKFTVTNNKLYLNVGKLQQENVLIGKASTHKKFALPEFPITDYTFTNLNGTNYEIKNGLLIFNDDESLPNEGQEIRANYSLQPIITYSLKSREDRNDIVFKNINMNINNIGVNSGAICLFNSYGNIDFPLQLILKTNGIFGNKTLLTAKLEGLNGFPIRGRLVTFEIITNDAVFAETFKSTYSGYTKLDGTVDATVINQSSQAGFYIEKEWVNGNVITLPFSLNAKKEEVFLYYVLQDDPILGKRFADTFEEPLEEYYSSNFLESYYVAGKKVAYLKLITENNKLNTKFIKPTSVVNNTSSEVTFRNLYIKDKNKTILTVINDYELDQNSIPVSGSEYKENSLPISNKIELYKTTIGDSTVITFEDSIPFNSSISGYWIAINSEIKVNAYYEEGDMRLTSNTELIKITNIKSENAFMISGTSVPNQITELGDYGYFTVSDYLNNPYGLIPCMNCCVYSDAIDKRCAHPDYTYSQFYIKREDSDVCIHSDEYDASIIESEKCYGKKMRIMNPFLPRVEFTE